MIVCVQDDVEVWLQRVCKQVEIPNVKLEYRSAADTGTDRDLSKPTLAIKPPHFQVANTKQFQEQSLPIAWESSIHKGKQFLGKLAVRIDEEQTLRKPNFFDACQLADTLSLMATDYAKLKQSLQTAQQSANKTEQTDDIQQVNVLVEQSLKTGVKLTGYRGAAFFLMDETGTSLRLKHYCHQNLQELPATQRTLQSSPYDRDALLQDVSVCQKKDNSEQTWLPKDVSTGICFQVATAEGAVGTLWFFDRRTRSVGDRDYHVLQSIAAQLGTILNRVILFRQTENHRRMKTELRLASATQPAKTLEYVSATHKMQCYGKCLSQYDVGGDLCELIPLSEKSLFVVVGDASGNSIPAAMVMTAVRGAIYALVADCLHKKTNSENQSPEIDPAHFMEMLNRMLVTLTGAHQFMSCICGLFDLEKMTFNFCNAGHPSPIHLSQKTLQYLPSHGLLLGIDENVEYEQGTISITKNDVLVLYTDGISEAMCQNTRRLFRQDGIAAATQISQHENAETIFQSIWNRMLAHSAGSEESDDATALVIKFME